MSFVNVFSESKHVFFSVAADTQETYEAGDIIKFSHIFSNVNTGFPGWNPPTNQFTCPYDGYYRFTVTLFKSDGYEAVHNFYARLRMSDSTDIMQMRNERYEEVNGWVMYSSTMSAIVPCQQGKQVWAAISSGGTTTLYDCNTCHLNQFSGRLIKVGLEE